MRSDDDGFVSRQVASSVLLYNTSLDHPVPFRTPTFDVSKFASLGVSMEPSAVSSFPLYATIEWWFDRAMTQIVSTQPISFFRAGLANGQARTWRAQIPCRSDFVSVTLTSDAAASLAMNLYGSSRVLPAIVQQVRTRNPSGGGPFSLVYSEQFLNGPTNGAEIVTPPWIGEVQVWAATSAVEASGSYVTVRNIAGANDATDDFIMPLNVGRIGGAQYATARFGCSGQQLQIIPAQLQAGVQVMKVTVQPISGHLG